MANTNEIFLFVHEPQEVSLKHLLDELQTILSKEIILHQQLLDALEKENEGIGRTSGSALLLLQSLKTQSSHKIARLEKERIQVVQQLAQEWSMESKDLPLSIIISKISDEVVAISLRETFESLKDLMTQIHHVAQQNKHLSEARLGPIEMSLKVLSILQKRQQTYSETGTLQNPNKSVSRISI